MIISRNSYLCRTSISQKIIVNIGEWTACGRERASYIEFLEKAYNTQIIVSVIVVHFSKTELLQLSRYKAQEHNRLTAGFVCAILQVSGFLIWFTKCNEVLKKTVTWLTISLLAVTFFPLGLLLAKGETQVIIEWSAKWDLKSVIARADL